VEDTSTAVLEPSTEVESAPETETVDETTNVEEISDAEQETERDFDAELAAAREEAAKEAREALRVEYEEQQTKTQYQRDKTQAELIATKTGAQKVYGLLGWMADRFDAGATKEQVARGINPKVVEDLGEDIASMVATNQWVRIGDNFANKVKKYDPDWTPSTELLRKHESAMASRDPDRMFEMRWEFQEAVIEAKYEKRAEARAQEIAKELNAKSKSAAQVAAAKAGDSRRANAEMPTTVSGGSGRSGTITSMGDADRAYNKGEITGAQYSKYAQQYGVSLG
jgi:hypothetical protein